MQLRQCVSTKTRSVGNAGQLKLAVKKKISLKSASSAAKMKGVAYRAVAGT